MEEKQEQIVEVTDIADPTTLLINRAALANALKALRFKVKAKIPVLNLISFRITPGKFSGVTLTSTNLEVAVTCEVEADIKPLGELGHNGAHFALDLRALETAIKGAPKKGKVTVQYSHSKRGLISWPELGAGNALEVPAAPGDDYPMIPTPAEGEHMRAKFDYNFDNMAGLVDALGRCSSKDDDRHFLCGINFDGKEAACTDGRRLALMPFAFELSAPEKEDGLKTLIVSMEAMTRAAKLSGPGTITACGQAIYFSTPARTITTRMISGNYPNYKQVMPKMWTTMCSINGSALLPVLLSLPNVPERDKAVTLNFTGSEYSVICKGNKVYSAPLIEGIYKEPFKISFNPQFIIDVLQTRQGDIVQMRFNETLRPGAFYNGNGAEYILMPLRS